MKPKYVRLDSGELNGVFPIEALKKTTNMLKDTIREVRKIKEQADIRKRENIVVKLTNTNSMPAFIPLEKVK
jgi:hypothetical protein